MLDLRYNATSKIYEAPFQMKANNGIYLIDDFGRQRATPAEVLNRWIVPMERRVDYLSFMSGGKMTAPFETFLVFSTNLNPADLGDEAFLRRIQYKMLLRGPAESEFVSVSSRGIARPGGLPAPPRLVGRLLEKHYRRTGKPMRRCHPRDVLHHAINLIHFEKLPEELTDELMDRAFASCFLEEEKDGARSASPVLPAAAQSASDYWGDRLAPIPTAFGNLAVLASLRDAPGRYRDVESDRLFGENETGRVLSKLHSKFFVDWLTMSLERRRSDLMCYFSTEGQSSALARSRHEWIERLIPAGAKQQERDLFMHDLDLLLDVILPEPKLRPEPHQQAPRLERIA